MLSSVLLVMAVAVAGIVVLACGALLFLAWLIDQQHRAGDDSQVEVEDLDD
jgi:hypothetical protein